MAANPAGAYSFLAMTNRDTGVHSFASVVQEQCLARVKSVL